MARLEELRQAAIEMLELDDELFCECVEELDCYNGFADGYRCYDMSNFNEMFSGLEPLEIIGKISEGCFNANEMFFVDTIYGIESTDFREDVYRSNTTEEEVLDNVLDCIWNLNISDSDFTDLVEQIIGYDEDEDEDEEDEE